MFKLQTADGDSPALSRMEKKKRTASKSMIQLKSAEDVMNLFEDVVTGPIEITPLNEGEEVSFFSTSLKSYSGLYINVYGLTRTTQQYRRIFDVQFIKNHNLSVLVYLFIT